MTSSASRKIVTTCAVLGLAAVGLTTTTKPANAWWRYGWGGGAVWVPPVVVAPPAYYPAPAYYAPPARAWIPAHWENGYWIPGHWN